MRVLRLYCFAVGYSLIASMVILSACNKPRSFKPNGGYGTGTPVPQGTAIPILSGFKPGSGLPNTVLTIVGNEFDQTLANNTVTINGVAATVNSVSATQIVITIPTNATTGKIVLKTGGTTLTSTTDFKVLDGTVTTFYNLGTNYVEHIAFDGTGNLYGENSNSILEVSLAGQLKVFAGANSGFKSLWGIATNSNLGDVYVADRDSYYIYRINSTLGLLPYSGTGVQDYKDGFGAEVRFSNPTGLAIDPAGNLYTTDTYRVRQIKTGQVITLAGNKAAGYVDGKGAAAQFGNLSGIAVDGDGNVYVSDRTYLNVRKIATDGTVTTVAGSGSAGFADGPGASAQFSDPINLAIDPNGNILVADGDKTKPYFAIRMINKLGVVSTLIKGNSLTGVVNGPIATASVNAPDGMVFDKQGNLYIANTGANIISKITFK
ncbi:hypothetical protein FO440_08560 [Mucilaginibacter corticis]|uniref:IPT/TIG domain-containing protein n=1 Tax=Mucilaginibacter corticis TaxID=2597670 RepID=A0A556MW98_9SPHI|nr:IPT/TIG domain-containing protein [Mucilaginibacter corticis]TSJ44210.1 hypothetical protein FO440_08560 [Mucilaginibacter corticis]